MAPQADPIETDALIVGAGPAGLFQVFELGLLEISAHVVDSLPQAGGQPVELYPDKPIFDIPGVPVCTGRELTDSLLKQIAPFAPGFHFNQEVSRIERQSDGRFAVQTSHGTRFLAKTIFVAAGVGAFRPRTLKVEGLDAFEGTQLFYRVRNPADLAGRELLIVGASDTALEWAIDLATGAGRLAGGARAGKVTLLHRRDVFDAAPATVEKMKALCAAGAMEFITGQVTAPGVQAGKLTHATVTLPDGSTRAVPLDLLLVFSGLSPKLGPVADWGLQLERKQLTVDTEKFSTSEPGIFAVGDINTYPGKKKLILSAFHECALAAFGAAALVFPDRPVQLQYTTTSPRLHRLLGATIPTVP